MLQALGGVIALDIIGVLRGWQFFDHAGHLGGVLFTLYVGVVQSCIYTIPFLLSRALFMHSIFAVGCISGGSIVCLSRCSQGQLEPGSS